MGALTLKSFPFELRGWDIEKFESIDPTDGFGSSTRVYISKQQIIQIEPDHSKNTTKIWLSDKGRQFFDGVTTTLNHENNTFKKDFWQRDIKNLLKILYLYDHCSVKTKKTYILTVVFENLGLEMLSLLKILEQSYPLLRLRRAEKSQSTNDLEFNFQLNSATNPSQLKLSTLCLLVSTNPRYEGYNLNLDLRQRYLKGNFKCLSLGSATDLTFPSVNIGTNLQVLKSIAEGNSYVCQDFKGSKNPILIFNNDLCKRTLSAAVIEMIKTFSTANTLNLNWNGLNILSSTLNEVGTLTIENFSALTSKDFKTLSSFYFINVNLQQVPYLKKLTEAKLLGYQESKTAETPRIPRLLIDQNSSRTDNKGFWKFSLKTLDFKQYSFFPTKMFYENEEVFLNTEGLIKRTSRLITKRKTRDGWKLLRNLIKNLKMLHNCLNIYNKLVLSFSLDNHNKFSTFVNFQFRAVEKLENVTHSLTSKNQPFFIYRTNQFKSKIVKLENTKLKYFIDDFFSGGKDQYSKNSLVLANCSKILRAQSTNFF